MEDAVKTTILNVLCRLHSDESGQDLIEYAFAAALIGFGAITTMSTLAGSINNSFSKIGSTLGSATGSKG
jgi:pilus assembly protein Flp/PilA